MDEIMVLQTLRGCQYVIQVHEVLEDADSTFIVLERVKGDMLIDRLIKNKKYTEYDAKMIALNLLKGVAYCHKHRIANRNLQLENLLLVRFRLSIYQFSDNKPNQRPCEYKGQRIRCQNL